MAALFQIGVLMVALVAMHLVTAHPGRSDEDMTKRGKSSKSSSSGSGGKETIYIAGFYPRSGAHTSWYLYSQSFPFIIEAALDEINNDPSILPDYHLELVSRDTEGEGGLALYHFFELLQEKKKKFPIMMGPGRSAVALALAQTMDHFNMIEIVFSTRSSSFSNKDVYPNAFASNFLNSAFNPIKIGFMDHEGLTSASTVTLNDNIYYSETSDLHEGLRDAGYGLVSGTVMHLMDVDQSQSAANVITLLKAQNPEVVFVSMTVLAMATFVCEAHKQNLKDQMEIVVSGPSLPDNWQHLYGAHTDCTEAELRDGSHGIFGVDHFYLREDGDVSVSGKTAGDFTTWLNGLALPTGALLPRLSPFAYDATYAMALALHDAASSGTDIEDFDYDRADIGGAIKSSMQGVSFEGVTGPVSFQADGTRHGCTYLFRVDGQSDIRERLAVYRSATQTINWIAAP